MLPMQGAQVWSLVRELHPTWHNWKVLWATAKTNHSQIYTHIYLSYRVHFPSPWIWAKFMSCFDLTQWKWCCASSEPGLRNLTAFALTLLEPSCHAVRKSKLPPWRVKSCKEALEDEIPWGERGHEDKIQDTLANRTCPGPQKIQSSWIFCALPATSSMQSPLNDLQAIPHEAEESSRQLTE